MIKGVIFALCFLKASFLGAQSFESKSVLPTNKIYVGIEGTLLANVSSFQGNNYVDNRLRKPPLITRAFGLSFRQNILRRIALQSGVSVLYIGYRSKLTSNYQGNKRYQYTSTGENKFFLVEVPLQASYLMRMKNSKFRKYVSLGASLLFNPNSDLKGLVGTSGTYYDSFSGDLYRSKEYRYPTPRLSTTMQLGIGIERDISTWGLVTLGLVYNQGFSTLARWDLEYKTWDISEEIDGIEFKNTIINKGTYIGLDLSFKFSPSLPKKR